MIAKTRGRAALTASAMGYPLTEVVIRRFGRKGAAVAEAVSVGLMIRDVALIASGTPGRLRRVPALLLWLEAAAAAAAATTGLPRLKPGSAAPQAVGGRPAPAETARRTATALLFGLHTIRFWIYLRPDQGRRPTIT